jgi:GINS complex subunit 4
LEENSRLSDEERRLTDEELVYAKEYQAGVESHFKFLASRHMPSNLQALDTAAMKPSPCTDQHTFLRVVRDVSAVVEEETDDAREEVVDLKAGDQHIMRYRPLAGLLDSGHVVLI